MSILPPALLLRKNLGSLGRGKPVPPKLPGQVIGKWPSRLGRTGQNWDGALEPLRWAGAGAQSRDSLCSLTSNASRVFFPLTRTCVWVCAHFFQKVVFRNWNTHRPVLPLRKSQSRTDTQTPAQV